VVVGHWEKAVNRETLRQELDTGYQPA